MMDLIQNLKRRLDSYINRTTLIRVNRENMADVLVVRGLFGQIKNVELFEPFGMSAGYVEGAEVLRMSVGGYEDHTVAVGVADKRFKPRPIADGEVIFYSMEDKESPHRIHLKKGRIIETKCGEESTVTQTPESYKIDIKGTTVEVKDGEFKITVGANEFTMTAENIETTMDLIAQLVSVATHVHPGVFPGNSSTLQPTPGGAP